jgi:hypothetical protein
MKIKDLPEYSRPRSLSDAELFAIFLINKINNIKR